MLEVSQLENVEINHEAPEMERTEDANQQLVQVWVRSGWGWKFHAKDQKLRDQKRNDGQDPNAPIEKCRFFVKLYVGQWLRRNVLVSFRQMIRHHWGFELHELPEVAQDEVDQGQNVAGEQ